MPHAIIRGGNGRRHEVDFGNEAVRVEIHASEETVEIFIEADFETLPEQRPKSGPAGSCSREYPCRSRRLMEQIEAVESFLSIPEPDPALRNEPRARC